MGLFLPKLDKTMPIVSVDPKKVDPRTGLLEAISTPQFQRWWQTQSLRLDSAATLGSIPTVADGAYNQADQQAVYDFLNSLQRGLGG